MKRPISDIAFTPAVEQAANSQSDANRRINSSHDPKMVPGFRGFFSQDEMKTVHLGGHYEPIYYYAGLPHRV